MKFRPSTILKNERMMFGKDADTDKICLAIPVFNGLAEYLEYYELTLEELAILMTDSERRMQFVDDCRNRRMDQRLIIKPGPGDIRGFA